MNKDDNLVPFATGEDSRRNLAGRPKGSKSISTIVRELEDENFDWSILPADKKKLIEKYSKMGTPLRAITVVALIKALKGNVKAMAWLGKTGWGDKLDITSDGKAIEQPLIVSAILPRQDKHQEDQ